MKRPVTQHPKQRAGSSFVYFRLIQRWGVPSAFSVHAVARRTLTKVQFGPGTLRLLVAFKRILFFRRSLRGGLHEASTAPPGDADDDKETSDSQRSH